MTILLISHTADLNGAEKSLADLALGLKEQGIDYLVLCPRNGPLPIKLREVGITTYIMNLPRPQRNLPGLITFFLLWFPTILRLTYLLRSKDIDTVYNNTIDGLYAPFAAYLVNIPCVWHVREVKPNNRQLRKLFAWLLRHLSTTTVFNSQAAMKAYASYPAPHWKVIYNGIQIDDVPLLSSQNIPMIVAGFAGQMVENKHPERFVNALALAKKSYPKLSGMMVGDGVLFQEIELLIKNKGLTNSIHMLGRVEDMSTFYQTIDMLVLTSDQESFGRVLVEAMSYGRTVIAANVGGVPEVVIDGETGFLIPPDDVAAYAEKVVLLATNSDLRSQMGLAGYERACANFSIAQYRQQLIDVLRQPGKRKERQ